MLKKKIGIDLGTSKTVIYSYENGIVFNEPTIIAIDNISKKLLAIGNEAKLMLGKTPETVTTVKPIKEGVIANYKVTQAFLEHIINQYAGNTRFFKPDLYISIPVGITSVQKRAVQEAALGAGAGNVHLIPSPLLAAIGNGMKIFESFGNTVVSMGGGISEMAVISLGGLVIAQSVQTAGDSINEAIIVLIKKEFGLTIGEGMADQIKHSININNVDESPIEIRGRDSSSGMPRSLMLSKYTVVNTTKQSLNALILLIRTVLEKTPPELSSDIMDAGIMLTGGSANIPGITQLLTKAIGVSFFVPDEPELSVIKGIEKVMKDHSLISGYMLI